jgi:hypothetical protein
VTHLFLADDGGGFWHVPDWELDPYEHFPYPNLVSDTRDALLKQSKAGDGAEPVWLITDARFEFEDAPEYGGYRLCRDFLDVSPANSRAVIYSEEPKIPPTAGDQTRVCGIVRTSNPKKDFQTIINFLKSGACHRVDDFSVMIRQLLALGPVLELAAADSVPVFRPPELMSTRRKPAYAGDVLLAGFGSSCVPPFSHLSSELFGDDTRDELGHAVLGSSSSAKWAELRQILHPYDSLEIACAQTMEFSGLGALRCFWEMTWCGGVPHGMSTSLHLDTGTLSPEKQRWIREKRAELRKALSEMFAESFAPASLANLLKGTMREMKILNRIALKIEDLS